MFWYAHVRTYTFYLWTYGGDLFFPPIMPFDDYFPNNLSDASCLLILGLCFTFDVHTFVTDSQLGARMYARIYAVSDYNFSLPQGMDFDWRRIVFSSRFFFSPLIFAIIF